MDINSMTHAIPKRIFRLSLLIALSLMYAASYSQKPVIRGMDKTSASSGEVVTLQGTFSNDVNSVSVSFGAMRGNVQFVSNQLLEVRVPSGATYENVVVTDLASGLSDQTNYPVLYSFGGNHGIAVSSLEGQRDFSSETGLYDLCMCDFDNDGRTDIATANDGSNTLSLLANTTASPGLTNISFNRIPFLIGAHSIHARCGDLNGDGKPDLIVSEGGANGDRVFIFRNTSTGAGDFTFSIQALRVSGKKVKRTEIDDLDNDGRPEVVITNQTGNDVTILVNQSTPAAISFAATPVEIEVPDATSTDGLAIEDLDNDGRPEIITSQFLAQTSNVFILKNTSVPGSISFSFNQMLALSGTVVNLEAGDLDGDAKPDIAATQLIGSGTVSIFRNESDRSISFASPVSFATDARPWGLDFGDIDGDGLADVIVASLERSITVLNNESTPGTLQFSTLIRTTTFINRHVGVGDVDGDAKPDVVFTSVDDNINNIPASRISVFRNRNCLVPFINPAGPITVCSGFPLQLTTQDHNGATYEWKDGAGTLASGADAYFDVTSSGTYTVTVIDEGSTCVKTSNAVAVTVDPGTTSGVAIVDNDGPVCLGSTMSLSVTDVGATGYLWTGPNGYTGSGLTPASIADFQRHNAGRYSVDIMVNGCIAQQTSTVVEIVSVPDFQITHTGPDIICPPATKTLNILSTDPGYTYQWAERTSGDIAGATGRSLSVNVSGEYFVKARNTMNATCPAVESSPVIVNFSPSPVADFSMPAIACTNEVINFINQSTGASAHPRFYEWNFGNAQTSSDENASSQYSTPGTYTVSLEATYDNGACPDQVSKTIEIQNPPIANITTASGFSYICSGDTLELGVDGTFMSYQWSTGETTPTIDITLPGVYSVDVFNGTCRISAVADLEEQPSPAVLVTADPAQLNEGETSQLNATGLLSYFWEPAVSLNDPSIANPVAAPLTTTIYSVRGVDDNGCAGFATVEVSVIGDLITNKLRPSKFVSPNNGDAINNFWLVENILSYPQCAVSIYDDKGLKLYEAKPYNNDWDGTFRGRQLPDGVYYYIIRCDGEESKPKSGSITILR